jgi:UDP-GlcNAc:undecaprenyl-phosphate GlcNAc-1-phosphate transferase
MGDCGSLFIGSLLAGAALVPVVAAGNAFTDPALLAVVILVVPLFDTGFVLVLRRLAGRPATRGGTDHVSHRLVSLGFSERSAVRVLYLLGLAGGVTAWALQFSGVDSMLPLAALFGVLVTLLGIYLARVPAYNAEDFVALQKSSFAPFLKDLTFRWHAGQVMLDLVLITACYYLAYRLRFSEGGTLENFLPTFTASLPFVLGVKLASLYVSGLYQRSWETFGLRDIAAVVRGVGLGSILSVLAAAYFYRLEGFSRVVFVLDFMLLSAAVVATRASFRTMNLVAATRSKRNRRVLVYGAGAFGQLLVREMRANSDWNMNPVAFLDDDPMKARRWIEGVPVRGALRELEDALSRYEVDEVVLSSPSINGSIEDRIREVCSARKKKVRRLHMAIR